MIDAIDRMRIGRMLYLSRKCVEALRRRDWPTMDRVDAERARLYVVLGAEAAAEYLRSARRIPAFPSETRKATGP